MADPALFPDDLILQLKTLERRVRQLETSNRLLASSIKGGSLTVYDTAGHPIAIIGDRGAAHGIAILTPAGVRIFEVNDIQGFAMPWLATPWISNIPTSNPSYTIVTSGTFIDTYFNLAELVYGNEMRFRVTVTVDAATTGEMQLVLAGGGPVLGSVKTLPAATTVMYEYRITHGLTMGSGPFEVSLQVRRTSGAGNVIVGFPFGLHWGSFMSPIAGGWV